MSYGYDIVTGYGRATICCLTDPNDGVGLGTNSFKHKHKERGE